MSVYTAKVLIWLPDERLSAHKKIQLKAQNYELAVDRYMHPRMKGMHNENWELVLCGYLHKDVV